MPLVVNGTVIPDGGNIEIENFGNIKPDKINVNYQGNIYTVWEGQSSSGYIPPGIPKDFCIENDDLNKVVLHFEKSDGYPEPSYILIEDGISIRNIPAGLFHYKVVVDRVPGVREYAVIAYNYDDLAEEYKYAYTPEKTGVSCAKVDPIYGSATDSIPGGISITFTDAHGTPDAKYDLSWRHSTSNSWDGTIENISNGYWFSESQGTYYFQVRAYNETINTTDCDGNPITDPVISEEMSNIFNGYQDDSISTPSEPLNCSATMNQIGQFTLSFTPSNGNPTPWHNLYIDDVPYANNPVDNGDVITYAKGLYTLRLEADNGEGVVVPSENFEGQSCEVPIENTTLTITNDSANPRLGVVSFDASASAGWPLPRFDLYMVGSTDNILIEQGISSGYIIDPTHEGSEIYFFVANSIVDGEIIGSANSNSVTFDPADSVAITQFEVTPDYSIPEYTLEFAANGHDVKFDIRRTLDGVLTEFTDVSSPYTDTLTSADYNKDIEYELYAYNVFSNDLEIYTDTVGESPSAISDFSASDYEDKKTIITFTESTGYPTPTHDLYENDILIASDISSGYEHTVTAGTRTYFVRACNILGCIDSNEDDGIVYNPGKVIIDYDSYTFEGSGDGTVTINDGTGTFTPPTGITSVTVCIVGGGAVGGVNQSGYDFLGGNASVAVVATLTVNSEEVISLEVAHKGWVDWNPTPIVVHPAGDSKFGSLISSGAGLDTGFAGDGQAITGCDGQTYYHGNKMHWDTGITEYWNYGGEASLMGDGRDADQIEEAGVGGGGSSSGPAKLDGGYGRIVISWD